MAHTHGITKVADGVEFDCQSDYSVLLNVSGRTLVIGSPAISIFPKEKVYFCGENEKIARFIKDNKLKVSEVFAAKAKSKKVKEEKSEETPTTVAEPESEVSVQLGSSEDGVAVISE